MAQPPSYSSPPDLKILPELLTQAVKHRDIDQARKIFDAAFWNGIDFTPDWHHLLVAALLKDKPMMRLLATHGAKWTEEEARCLKDIFYNSWPELTATLQSSDIPVSIGNPSQPMPYLSLVKMGQRVLDENKGIADEPKLRKKLDDVLSQGIVKYLAQGDIGQLHQLLRFRQPHGPVDIDREFRVLFGYNSQNSHQAMKCFNEAAAYFDVKPVQIEIGIAWNHPEVVIDLALHRRLHQQQPDRMRVIEAWSGANSAFAATTWKKHAQENQYQLYKSAAAILFREGRLLTTREADWFIRIHKASLQTDVKNFERVYDDLKSMGFFNQSVWTKERLQALGAQAAEGSLLRLDFNRKLAADRFGNMDGKQLLKPENFALFVEAHRKGHYQASFKQGTAILDLLAEKYRKTPVPVEVKEALRDLKEGGAHYHTHGGHDYLGKKEPGLGKILLDLGFLKPNHFNRDTLSLDARKSRAFTEFYNQVELEYFYPEEFIPLRGKISSYQDCMRDILNKNPPVRKNAP